METKRITSRTRQAMDTKNRIYEAAIGLFYKKGVDAVTITDICTAAKVSVGSFYKYFNTKMDILALNFEEADEYFFTQVRPAITGKTPKERILNYFDHYLTFVESQPMDFVKNLYRPDTILFIKEGRTMQAVLNEVIEEGLKNGGLAPIMSASEINEYLFVSIRGLIFHWCLHDGSFDLRKRGWTYLNLQLAGF